MILSRRVLHRALWMIVFPAILLILYFGIRARKAMPVMDVIPVTQPESGDGS